MASSSNFAIGIDIGTTFSCVAVIKNGKANIISNPEGYKKTPSVVGFRNNERFVGNPAKNQAALNSRNTIFNIKRFIGRRYDDPNLEAETKNAPFRVITNYPSPVIEVDFKGKSTKFTPEEITSIILQKMKNSAERYLEHKVRDAVITVPACFNDRQRQATKDAAEIAGLNVLRLLNEPTAAALTYAIEKGISKEKKFLILDFGGGTFDVSIIKFLPSKIADCRVIATCGDAYLGGTDFDERLIKYFTEEFNRKHNVDIRTSARAMRRLRTACELAKIRLSTNIDAPLEVDALFNGIDFYTTITRTKFEELCEDLFFKIFEPIGKVLRNAKMDKSEVDDFLLVGGSTRIPKLHELLEKFFDVKGLNNYVNADEATAYGAAVQAALLTKHPEIERIAVFYEIPINISINFRGNKSKPKVVPQNSSTTNFTISFDNLGEKGLVFEACENNRDTSEIHHRLGKFMLEVLKLNEQRGAIEINVTFEYDKDRTLLVSAVQQSTGKACQIRRKNGQLSRNDIAKMIEKAQSYEREDMILKERIEARNEFEQYIYKIRDIFENNSENLSGEDTKEFNDIRSEQIDWLEDNENAEKEIIISRLRMFEETCERIIKKNSEEQQHYDENRTNSMAGVDEIKSDPEEEEDDEIAKLIENFENLKTGNDKTADEENESKMEEDAECLEAIVVLTNPLQNVL